MQTWRNVRCGTQFFGLGQKWIKIWDTVKKIVFARVILEGHMMFNMVGRVNSMGHHHNFTRVMIIYRYGIVILKSVEECNLRSFTMSLFCSHEHILRSWTHYVLMIVILRPWGPERRSQRWRNVDALMWEQLITRRWYSYLNIVEYRTGHTWWPANSYENGGSGQMK